MTNFSADANLRTLLQVDTLLVMGLMLMSNYTSLPRLKRVIQARIALLTLRAAFAA